METTLKPKPFYRFVMLAKLYLTMVTIGNPSDYFASLSRNLSALAYGNFGNDKIVLKRVLEKLNQIRYDGSWKIKNERGVLVVNQCCLLVQTDDELVDNVVKLFHNLLSKQSIKVGGKTLSIAVSWVLDCLKQKKQDLILLELLVLQELVRGKSHLILEHTNKLLSTCTSLMTEFRDEDPPQICFNCLNCVEALVFTKDGELSECIVPQACDILLKFSYEEIASVKSPIWKCKCLVIVMRGLSNIAEHNIHLMTEALPQIFGAIKGYMLYGIEGLDEFKLVQVAPLNIALPEELKPVPSVKKANTKYDRKSKKKNVSSISNVVEDENEPVKNSYSGFNELLKFYVTSDSDFSESEGGAKGSKLRHLSSKVRRCSLILLGTLLMKGDLKSLTRFLPSFLDGSQSRTLVTCLLKDPSASVRSEVLTVLSIILTKYKPFMLLADSITKSSFTTMSNYVAEISKNIHKSLTQALKAENYPIVKTYILKTISDLIRCSPYQKLEKNLLTDLAKEVAEYFKAKDANIGSAALVVFGCIASVNPQIDKVKKVIFVDQNVFDFCTKILSDYGNFNIAVAIECLQVLSALIRNYPFETVLAHPKDVIRILGLTSTEHDIVIRFYAARLSEAVVNALQTGVGKGEIPVDLAASVWREIIHGPLSSLMQDQYHPLRAAGCDCLSSLAITNEAVESSLIYEELPRGDQIICITHLLGCARDEEPNVRSAAIRALAVLIQFPTLRKDSLFFLDTIDLFFNACSNEHINVRIQASWLFRHIAEAALANHSDGCDEDFTDTLISKLLVAGETLSNDQKKGKPYAVRGISNLLAMVTQDFVSERKDLVHRAVDALVINATTGTFMKARWNACYALGAVLANKSVCFETRGKIFPALFDLVQNYKNFKVRISAGHALASPTTRESYQDFYLLTWQALVNGLENAENMADFSEYQHRDHLVDQLCTCMCHLVSIITTSDLTALKEIVVHYSDHLNHQFTRFKNRIIPEKSNIASADAKLAELRSNLSLHSDQKNALVHISSLFSYDAM